MCGRAACSLCKDGLQKACSFKDGKKYVLPEWKSEMNCKFCCNYEPAYNIPPQGVLPVIVRGNCFKNSFTDRVIHPMVWGVIPPWYKGKWKLHGLTTHNCCKETMLSSRLYAPLFRKGNRCVVVCDGFYEWKTTNVSKGQKKQPYFIYTKQNFKLQIENMAKCKWEWSEDIGWNGPKLTFMAGLFNAWESVEGETIYSCAVITCEADSTLSWLHHRCPAILKSDEDIKIWLDDGKLTDACLNNLLKPIECISWHPVSSDINRSSFQGPTCNQPINLDDKKEITKSPLGKWLIPNTKSPTKNKMSGENLTKPGKSEDLPDDSIGEPKTKALKLETGSETTINPKKEEPFQRKKSPEFKRKGIKEEKSP